MNICKLLIITVVTVFAGCGGGGNGGGGGDGGGGSGGSGGVEQTPHFGPSVTPTVTLDPPAAGASQLSGHAYNIDPSKIKVVIYVLTNQWYVQPLVDAPFTDISADGSWSSYTHPWDSIVALLVDPANYTPAATKITNPTLDPGVLAWTEYPSLDPTKFYVGIWGVTDTSGLDDVKGKFDFVVNQDYQDVESANPFLSACAARGLPCILSLDYTRADPNRSTYEADYVTNFIKGIKGNAGYAGMLLVDEPWGDPNTNMSVSSCEQIYQQIKSVDPNSFHPVFVDSFTNNDDPVSEVDAYKNCYDRLFTDDYPFTVKAEKSSTEYFMYNAAYFPSHAAPKPWWPLVQMGNVNDAGSTLFIVPGIPDEQRMITYIPLIFGAKTVSFYTYSGLPNQETWTFVQRLAQELRQQRDVWKQPVLSTPAVSVSGSEYIKTGLRQWNGDYYLIAASWYDGGNLATPVFMAQANVQITIKGVSNAAVMTIGTTGVGSAAGGRCLGTTDSSGTFMDNFDPYAVHVYKIVPGTRSC